MSSTTTVSAPTRRRSPAPGGSGLASALLGSLALLVLGVLLGLLWWWLAPLARADVQAGQVLLTGHQELQVSQDGWFSVVTGAAGVVAAAVLVARRRGHDPAVLLLGPPAALVVSLLTWATGSLLGPSSLAAQVRDGATHPITPLQLHAYGALLVGPLLFAVTRALSALFSRTGNGGPSTDHGVSAGDDDDRPAADAATAPAGQGDSGPDGDGSVRRNGSAADDGLPRG